MKLTLGYPPSANRYWRVFQGIARLSQEARSYKAGVVMKAKGLRLGKPLTSPVAMTLNVYRPRKAGDLSNRLKVLEDALQGVAFDDDDQVVEIHMYRHDDKENPRVEVVIEERP